jgi:hypothetical protein
LIMLPRSGFWQGRVRQQHALISQAAMAQHGLPAMVGQPLLAECWSS